MQTASNDKAAAHKWGQVVAIIDQDSPRGIPRPLFEAALERPQAHGAQLLEWAHTHGRISEAADLRIAALIAEMVDTAETLDQTLPERWTPEARAEVSYGYNNIRYGLRMGTPASAPASA